MLSTTFEALNRVFWQHPWAQLIGLVALVIGGLAFLHHDDHKLRRNLTLYTVLMGIQFMMLGLWSAAFTAWLSSVRTYISTRTRNLWVMSGFLILVWAVTIPKVSEVVHVLPIIGTTLGTWAMFREHGLRMRSLMLMGSLCWFSHNFMVGSIGGAIIEGAFVMINSRTMLKLLRQQREEAKNAQ
ncbi:YgjV family protein [Neptunicella sp. SCSIO 80796]|uniref:YgjV family protein n=1 Tax=Neptunicella plasticusilytica TaxID=3117012 RepID=UPI003A4D44EA